MEAKRILVVDDEELNREYLTHLLSSHYDVTAVSDGEQAIQAASDAPPSLILLDIQMPGIDGYETCKRLKEDSRTHDCPVIFVSSNDQEEEILKGYEVGAADYFVKPFKSDELQIKVQHNIEIDDQRKTMAQQLGDANKTAFQAMTDTSAYGAMNIFLLDSLKCDDIPRLAELLFETTTNWGLRCALQTHSDEGVSYYSETGQVSPMEERVLTVTRDKERIQDFGSRTVFSDKHCSLLVKNMPLDDEVRYGNYKDYIARLIEGVEGRIVALINEHSVERRTAQLRNVLDFLLQTFRHIQEQNQGLRLGSATIVEQMLEELNLTIDELGISNDLTDNSEAKIMKVGETCLGRTNQLFSQGLKFNEQVDALIKLFHDALQNPELSDTSLSTLIESLSLPEVSN
ncbi:hypothetical protein MNBD_GAMMA15-1459 [hydrothermal vent metagenome]|uniref:Response regulatory domain-containing protein n=1 Tax=hydrothermal vent metagenome TaxID=652676 RepID=A0A3B0YM06_9ZZZZ